MAGASASPTKFVISSTGPPSTTAVWSPSDRWCCSPPPAAMPGCCTRQTISPRGSLGMEIPYRSTSRTPTPPSRLAGRDSTGVRPRHHDSGLPDNATVPASVRALVEWQNILKFHSCSSIERAFGEPPWTGPAPWARASGLSLSKHRPGIRVTAPTSDHTRFPESSNFKYFWLALDSWACALRICLSDLSRVFMRE
jgi:hypothetical protein